MNESRKGGKRKAGMNRAKRVVSKRDDGAGKRRNRNRMNEKEFELKAGQMQ